MIHLLVLAVAALHLQDPAGDAVGDGTLAPPTAPVYANTADFDLQSVTLTSDPKLTVRVQLGAVSDAAGLPNGFSNPILEVYLDTRPGGAQQLLPGSSMAMPPKHGWEIALRATGDEAYAVEARSSGSPGSWPRLPVTVDVQGNSITLHTQLRRPGRADVYALTGVYDPFTTDGWRPLTSSVSPWAFSSPSQRVPVVDLLASNQSAQRREIDSGVLSPYRSALHGLGWLLLMVLGLTTAAAGLVLRRRVRAPERPGLAGEAWTAPDPVARPPTTPAAGSGRVRGSDADDAATVGPSAIHERFLDEEEEAAMWPDAEASVDRAMAGAMAGAVAGAVGEAVGEAREDGPGDDAVDDAVDDARDVADEAEEGRREDGAAAEIDTAEIDTAEIDTDDDHADDDHADDDHADDDHADDDHADDDDTDDDDTDDDDVAVDDAAVDDTARDGADEAGGGSRQTPRKRRP